MHFAKLHITTSIAMLPSTKIAKFCLCSDGWTGQKDICESVTFLQHYQQYQMGPINIIKLQHCPLNTKQCRLISSREKNLRECRESNPGWLGAKEELYPLCCAASSPANPTVCSLTKWNQIELRIRSFRVTFQTFFSPTRDQLSSISFGSEFELG